MADVSWRFELDQGATAAQVQPFLIQKAASLTRRISTQARLNVPVRTGFLGRSIVEDPIQVVGPFRVESGVTATASHAAAVELGTAPHVIRPRNGQFLRFPGRDGRPVFVREVHHPGTRPRPYLRTAAEQVAREP